jgi:hypothetical protein
MKFCQQSKGGKTAKVSPVRATTMLIGGTASPDILNRNRGFFSKQPSIKFMKETFAILAAIN